MDDKGFVKGELDTKILILYVLRPLPVPVDALTLEGLCMLDEGVRYFDYAECLADLVATGHIIESVGPCYKISEKGVKNLEMIESSLAYSVRARADERTEPLAYEMRRREMIESEYIREGDAVKASLVIKDEQGEVINIKLTAPNETMAERICKNFAADAERIYDKILKILLEEEK